jgi:hypothetical protein
MWRGETSFGAHVQLTPSISFLKVWKAEKVQGHNWACKGTLYFHLCTSWNIVFDEKVYKEEGHHSAGCDQICFQFSHFAKLAWEEIPAKDNVSKWWMGKTNLVKKIVKGVQATTILVNPNFWNELALAWGYLSHWSKYFAWLMGISSHQWLLSMERS